MATPSKSPENFGEGSCGFAARTVTEVNAAGHSRARPEKVERDLPTDATRKILPRCLMYCICSPAAEPENDHTQEAVIYISASMDTETYVAEGIKLTICHYFEIFEKPRPPVSQEGEQGM
jgi:hypothetical protein